MHRPLVLTQPGQVMALLNCRPVWFVGGYFLGRPLVLPEAEQVPIVKGGMGRAEEAATIA